MFDAKKEKEIRSEYANGKRCGLINNNLIAQKYIADPLTIMKHKFDFRIYMLIASTNPLIVYYHDGFLRVSLEIYEKNSTEAKVHLTNTHLSKEAFELAKQEGGYQGMNETELRDFQMWTMPKLESYLYEAVISSFNEIELM